MDISSPGALDLGQGAEPSFSWLKFLFSAKGRANRARFWGFVIAQTALFVVYSLLLGALGQPTEDTPTTVLVATIAISVIAVAIFLVSIYASIVIAIKRLHDRDRSGWFYLLALVPLVNIWIMVELYFLRGTRGENRFGPENGAPAGKALVDAFQ